MRKELNLNEILEELKERAGIKKAVRIKLKPFKRKVASVSIKKGIIYINSKLAENLTEEEIRYIIAHELLHIKHGIFHTEEFENELRKLCHEDKSTDIIRKFLNSCKG